MRQTYNGNIKRPKLQNTQLGILNIYAFCRKFSRVPRVQQRALLELVVSVFENIPKNLVVQGTAQLEHSSHIVKVGVEATY